MISAKAAISSFMVVFMAGGMTASAAPGAAPASRPVTVATFTVDLIRTSGVPEAGWGSEAERLMARAGIEDPGSPLTEGAAASLLRSMGLDAFTTSPEGLVSENRAGAFIRQAEGLLLPVAPAALASTSNDTRPGPGLAR